jgi:choline-glycine betaine transporter
MSTRRLTNTPSTLPTLGDGVDVVVVVGVVGVVGVGVGVTSSAFLQAVNVLSSARQTQTEMLVIRFILSGFCVNNYLSAKLLSPCRPGIRSIGYFYVRDGT